MRSCLALALVAAPAFAQDGGWELVVAGPITVRNRSLEGTPIKEVWAEGEIAAPALDVAEALMDVSRLPAFMPYMTSAKLLATESDGSVFVHTVIDLPLVGRRDYVVRTELKESIRPDGTGTFRNEWHAHPTYLPRTEGVVRIERNDGGWVVTPRGDGSTCWAVYRFTVDPGGWVPAFAANLGNQKGVKETYEAVAKEGQRRRAARLAAKPPEKPAAKP